MAGCIQIQQALRFVLGRLAWFSAVLRKYFSAKKAPKDNHVDHATVRCHKLFTIFFRVPIFMRYVMSQYYCSVG